MKTHQLKLPTAKHESNFVVVRRYHHEEPINLKLLIDGIARFWAKTQNQAASGGSIEEAVPSLLSSS
ncbi:hypothetical protein HAX54_048640 [Datura stramonium]|uniref:Uncharacterized protein n=1 Tax=Datura stramonium TaxID=4076 RepID=A0ABS8STX9_DATST|nr:hypothetical protein [Datura stramonium]